MKKFYSLFLILTALLCSGNAWGASPLTVADGSATENHSPVWGDWLNAASRSQVLYPASLLSEMENSNITSMTFYLSSSASAAWTSEFTIGLAVVEESSFAYDGGYYGNTYYYNSAATTTVYTGTLDGTGSTMVITFDTPFLYEGGNLLVNFSATGGNWKDATFAGETQTAYLSIASHSGAEVTSTGYGYQFLPKTSFAYTEAAPITCAKPTTVTVAEENITFNSATITLAGLTNATVEYKKKSATDYSVAQAGVTGNSYLLENLDSYTEYDVQVKNVCGGTDGESKYVKASFRTKCGPKTIPFEAYGFDDITYSYGQYAIPACWDKIASGNYPYVYGYNGKSGNSLYFNGTSEQAIIFPDFSKSIAGHTLTFYHRESVDENWYGTNYVYSKFEVGYVLNNVFTTISGPLAQLSAYAADPTEVAFTEALPTGAKLAIRYAGGANNGSGYIDDIAIKVTPSCEKPTLNNATDQTFEGATFTWDGSAAQYQYAVVASGASVEAWSEPTSDKTYTVTGQAAATTFDFYVRSYCSSTEQSEGVKKSFTTATVTAPTNVIISGETTDGANASWDAVAGISQYQYVVMEAGVAADWTSPTTVNTNAATISGLLPGQSYDFYVRSYYAANGATSSATPKKNFKTTCEDISSIAAWTDGGFEESDANEVPNCWIAKTSDESNTYKPAMYVNTSYSYVRTGSKSLLMKAYNDSGEGYAIFPVISDASLSSLQLKFWQKKETAAFILKVGYLTNINDLSTFVELHTCADATAWTEEVVNLSTLPNGARLAFYYFGTSSTSKYSVGVDDISFVTPPTCSKPTTLNEATDITPEGATFSWEGDADYFQYICVAGGTAEGDIDWTASTKVAKAETNQAVLSGKAAGTYDFYVRSWCSESEQSEALKKSFTTATVEAPTIGTITTTNNSANASWTAPTGISYSVQYQWSINGTDWSEPTSELSAAITSLEQNTNYTFYVRSYYDATHQSAEVTKAFTTECDPIAVSAAEYAETFDDITSGIPACWKNNEGTTTTESYKWNSAASGQNGRCVRFESKNNETDRTNILASPLFELNADADLSFYVKNFKGGDYKVQIAVDGGAREDLFTDLTNIQNWTKKEAALTAYNGHTIQFFFCGTSNWSESNDGFLYLDEFKIIPTACRKPASDPVVSSKDDSHATLTWTAGGTNTDYQFALVLKDEAPVWETANVISELTKSFENLSPLTWYDFYVRTYCDELNQSEARKVTFQTDCGVYALPFNEDFNSVAANNIPKCWDNAEGTSTDYYKWKGYTYGGTQGTNCVRFNSSTNDNGATNVLATPTIQLGEGNLLTFYAKNPTGGALKVQIKEEGEEAVDLLTSGLTDLTEWTLKYVAIPAAYNNKAVQILFHATSNEGDANAYIYIDDVRVARGETFTDTESNQSRFTTLKAAGETIDVIFNRTMLYNGDYNTLCLPFSLSAAQLAASPLANFNLKAFDFATIENEELQIAIASALSIEAGVPYFVAFQGDEANQTVQLYQDVVITADVPGNIENGDVIYQGVFNPVDLSANDKSVLFLAAGNTIYWPAQNKTVKGFRAYFNVTVGGGALQIKKGMPVRIVERAEVTTGIDNTNVENVTLKFIENNQVVIIRNGVKYTVQGQKIQ